MVIFIFVEDGDEFILIDNVYVIFEGFNIFVLDVEMQEVIDIEYFFFYIFVFILFKFLIVF